MNGYYNVVEQLLKDPRVNPSAEYEYAKRIVSECIYDNVVKL